MPRIGRAIAAGFLHHVIQRGNNREHVFFDEKDRKHRESADTTGHIYKICYNLFIMIGDRAERKSGP
jgi:REP element-mobilizing transposase RayT